MYMHSATNFKWSGKILLVRKMECAMFLYGTFGMIDLVMDGLWEICMPRLSSKLRRKFD